MTTDPRYDDICARRHELAYFATGFIPNRLPLEPSHDDLIGIADDLKLLAKHVDALVLAYGHHVVENSSVSSTMAFHGQVADALSYAIAEIEDAADDIAAEWAGTP